MSMGERGSPTYSTGHIGIYTPDTLVRKYTPGNSWVQEYCAGDGSDSTAAQKRSTDDSLDHAYGSELGK